LGHWLHSLSIGAKATRLSNLRQFLRSRTMMKLACIALLAACVQAKDFKVVFENTGAISGLSLYWTGVKEGLGNEMPTNLSNDEDDTEEQGGLESFQNFLGIGDKAGHMARYGSRFVVRGNDSADGPGFRAALQIQKGGETPEGVNFPYKIVITAIGASESDLKANVEFVHRGATGQEYMWIEPGHTIAHLTHGTQHNSFGLRDSNQTPQMQVTIFEDDEGEL
jgi:hypothetical protein